MQIRIKRPKEGPESSVVAYGPSKDPQIAAKGRELRNLLGLKPDIKEMQVYYGGYSGKDNEIDMMTRSMLQIMQEFAKMVLVPETDVTEGRAYPGLVDTQAGQPQSGPTMKIFSGNAASKDAYVAVQYDNRWFWIADTDTPIQGHVWGRDPAVLDLRNRGKGDAPRGHDTRQPVSAVLQEKAHEDQAHPV